MKNVCKSERTRVDVRVRGFAVAAARRDVLDAAVQDERELAQQSNARPPCVFDVFQPPHAARRPRVHQLQRGLQVPGGDEPQGRSIQAKVGVELKGRGVGGETRRQKSLRIGVHHADGVVWGPVYRTHRILGSPRVAYAAAAYACSNRSAPSSPTSSRAYWSAASTTCAMTPSNVPAASSPMPSRNDGGSASASASASASGSLFFASSLEGGRRVASRASITSSALAPAPAPAFILAARAHASAK
eukprot:31085-Pelagococcus_subviridis.AAC.19